MARVPEIDSSVELTAKMILNVENVGLTREQFSRLCRDNGDLRLELTARKEIVIMAPVHTRTGWQEGEIYRQLANWVEAGGGGIAFGPNAGFMLPNGAIRAPDASWMPLRKWRSLDRGEQDSFAAIVPDFVIELASSSDAVRQLETKMAEYVAVGVELAWLIDPARRSVVAYRRDQAPDRIENAVNVAGDPLLPGFTLQLDRIW